jgi:hypothetical protein
MTFIYIVRCNFTAPQSEQAWNAWYSGPKIKQMLAQPQFLSCQRFHRAAGTGRDYLALWTVASPEALRTAQYTSQWGFAEWERYVTAWSRDLFDGGAKAPRDFAVESGRTLEVISFDGTSADMANAVRARMDMSDVMWLPVAGLDRHTPMIGLGVSTVRVDATHGGANIQHGLYRPICKFQSAPSATVVE